MRKAVFFDIDGTLWNPATMEISDSTKEAIRLLKEKGHYTFICSGRTKAFIKNEELLALGFDGIIAGCGTHVELAGKVLVHTIIEHKTLQNTFQILKKYKLVSVWEGTSYIYVDEENFSDKKFLKILKQGLGDDLLSITEHEHDCKINKFSTITKDVSMEPVFKELGIWYDFIIHNEKVMEVVPKGYSKASGIAAICEALNISTKDTYAFGDSANDIEMLKYVGHGIAMGNGMEMAKEAAEYVTDGLEHDGIFNGLRHYGLI
ncbi:Cof-type HAD-IIB family hydrolase [Lachnospiraceae bacterium ZAX-1]